MGLDMQKKDAVLITGSRGLVGRNLVDLLHHQGYHNLLLPTSAVCNLTDRHTVNAYFQQYKPAYVFHLAGRVRGIMGNIKDQGAAFHDNILINTHVVEACRLIGVKKLGSGPIEIFTNQMIGDSL
jgi:GDP-L-fucose synthase